MKRGRLSISVDLVEPLILLIRGQKVILANDLAESYGVTTKALNQAVRRNAKRFPADFLFQLTREEKQEVVTNCDHLKKLKFSPQRPYAFTEHGAIMAATVLNSERAVEMSVFVVRAFVRLRQTVATNSDAPAKLTNWSAASNVTMRNWRPRSNNGTGSRSRRPGES